MKSWANWKVPKFETKYLNPNIKIQMSNECQKLYLKALALIGINPEGLSYTLDLI